MAKYAIRQWSSIWYIYLLGNALQTSGLSTIGKIFSCRKSKTELSRCKRSKMRDPVHTDNAHCLQCSARMACHVITDGICLKQRAPIRGGRYVFIFTQHTNMAQQWLVAPYSSSRYGTEVRADKCFNLWNSTLDTTHSIYHTHRPEEIFARHYYEYLPYAEEALYWIWLLGQLSRPEEREWRVSTILCSACLFKSRWLDDTSKKECTWY